MALQTKSMVKTMLMGLAAAGAVAAVAIAAGPKEGKYAQMETKEVAKVGEKAPDFTLTDTDGNTYTLHEVLEMDGVNAVVLEWFNPRCPFVVKQYDANTTMADTYGAFKDKGVKWMAINSGAPGKQGAGLELNSEIKADWNIAYPILIDESGDVGRMYGAKTTPHMYVINGDGVLAYAGAIDDNPSPRQAGEVNYVRAALTSILAGETVEISETRPYGCSVKYGSKN
ncbi:MAG: thioredoxin family protein [Planctomycetota bacterium]